jgi:uncharacterized membrane protein
LKNSDFRMSPSGNSRDTTISYILGILGGVFIVLSVIKSIISRGAVERIYGVLMISAFLMALTGIVFGVIGYHSEEGGVTSKKMAVYLNIVVFVIAGIFFIKGM